MSDDLLNRAARALREDRLEPTETASLRHPWHAVDGWSGIVKEVRRARRRRRLALMATLQIGLAVAGFGAWAAATGRLALPDVLPSVARPTTDPVRATPARSARPRRPPAQAVPTEQPAPAELAVEPATAVVPPVRVAPLRRPGPAATKAIVAPRPEPPTDPKLPKLSKLPKLPEVVYGEAHDAHFVRRDYAAALAAWDSYLALPSAPLAVEARYNRAIALVRLQRRVEAAEALEPFAVGHYGGYRRKEARALLSALRSPQP